MEETKLKFRLRRGKGSVSEFVDAAGNRFKPGNIVELPERYRDEKWLEVLKPIPIQKKSMPKKEDQEEKAAHLPKKRTKKREEQKG